MDRTKLGYWGPALVVVGVIAAIVSTALFHDVALVVALVVTIGIALVGLVLVGAARLR